MAEGQEDAEKVEAEQIYAVQMHERLEKARAYAKRLGVAPAVDVKNPKGQAFVNGRHFYINDVSDICGWHRMPERGRARIFIQ